MSSDEHEEEEIIDTSWFLTKEEMVQYLNDPARHARSEQRPTEAIFQKGRNHRGFTIVRKGEKKEEDVSMGIPKHNSILYDGIQASVVEENLGTIQDGSVDGSALIKPDDSFLTLPMPIFPGPVLTYKQLSDIYDRPIFSKTRTPTTATTALSTASTSPSVGKTSSIKNSGVHCRRKITESQLGKNRVRNTVSPSVVIGDSPGRHVQPPSIGRF